MMLRCSCANNKGQQINILSLFQESHMMESYCSHIIGQCDYCWGMIHSMYHITAAQLLLPSFHSST